MRLFPSFSNAAEQQLGGGWISSYPQKRGGAEKDLSRHVVFILEYAVVSEFQ